LPFEAQDEKEEAHIAPQHVQRKQPVDSKYKDRAELRRTGKDDEYKDVRMRSSRRVVIEHETFEADGRGRSRICWTTLKDEKPKPMMLKV
jgi:hypothetical protein